MRRRPPRSTRTDTLFPYTTLFRSATGCELRGDDAVRALSPDALPATAEDWDTEYLAPVLSAAIVDGPEAALDHIARHSSGHTDAIVAEDAEVAESTEERRVGKEGGSTCRYRWSPQHAKKKKQKKPK